METSEEKSCCENKKPCCLCEKMGGVFIVLIGVAILLGALDVLSKTMLEDKDVCVRRLREGYEFFKSMAQRRSDLKAAKAAAV